MEGKADAAGHSGIGRDVHAHLFYLRLEEVERQLSHAVAALAGTHAQRADTAIERHAESEPPISLQVGGGAGARQDGKA